MRTHLGNLSAAECDSRYESTSFLHLHRPYFLLSCGQWRRHRKTLIQRRSSIGGLCGLGEVEDDVLCFCFHEGDVRALSDGLDIPNAFAT